MSHALFIVGEPGAGKTTLARGLMASKTLALHHKPKWTLTLDSSIAAAGHYKGDTFDGADTVAYNGVEEALTFWETTLLGCGLTIFDGDRFSHQKALQRVCKSATPLCVLLLDASVNIVAARRQARSKQNETWVKGRITKAINFTKMFAEKDLLIVNATLKPEQIYALTSTFLSGRGVRL